MKKFILFLAAATLVAGNTFAQYKPTAGSFSTEVQFNPFNQKEQFTIDGLKFRYFMNENNALRLKLGLNGMSDKYEIEAQDRDEEDIEISNKSTSFKLELGYERHFNLSKRLSVYVGGVVGINKRFASTNVDYGKKGIEITNASVDFTNREDITDMEIGEDARASFGFNVGAISGVDFYVYKGLYVGAELGFSINTFKTNTVEIEYDRTKRELPDTFSGVSYKFYVDPVLRLGWTF